MRSVIISKGASRTLLRMPANTAVTIRAKIFQYAEDPGSLANNVVKLQGREGYWLRVGDWRVVFADDGRVMLVERIGPRGGVYD